MFVLSLKLIQPQTAEMFIEVTFAGISVNTSGVCCSTENY